MTSLPPEPVTAGERWSIAAWVTGLSVLVLGPALAPGFVLSYDMVWVPHLSVLRPDVWGLGSGLPRAVPSDAVVAVLGVVLPQQLVQKALLLAALVGAGLGGAALTRDLGRPARWAAATFAVWNPFVAERLALGHWPLLLGYAAMPWLVLAVRERRFARATLLLAATAMTPVSGVIGAVTALVLGRAGDAWRWLLVVAAVNAPWWVASLASPAGGTSDPAGVSVFATRGAGSTPPWLEVLALGGVWNSDVVPASRGTIVSTVITAIFAVTVLAGLVALFRSGRREVGRLAVLAVIGFAVALAGVAAPAAVQALVEAVPGAGLIRDGSRWVLLMTPAIVVGLAGAVRSVTARPATQVAGWLVALALPVALVPDLGWGVGGSLRAVDYPDAWETMATRIAGDDGAGDLLSLPFSPFRAPRWNHDRPVLDPAGRYFDRVTVTSDILTVGDTQVAGEDPRAAVIGDALAAGDWPAVAAEGVGLVVLDRSAPGAASARSQVRGLREVATSGPLELYEVPGATPSGPRWQRRAAVVTGWAAALGAVTGAVAIAVAQIGRRRKTARGR